MLQQHPQSIIEYRITAIQRKIAEINVIHGAFPQLTFNENWEMSFTFDMATPTSEMSIIADRVAKIAVITARMRVMMAAQCR